MLPTFQERSVVLDFIVGRKPGTFKHGTDCQAGCAGKAFAIKVRGACWRVGFAATRDTWRPCGGLPRYPAGPELPPIGHPTAVFWRGRRRPAAGGGRGGRARSGRRRGR